MSFLSSLFRKRPDYVHPVFGKMSFVKIDALKSYWEGRAFFEPTNSTVEVFVDGNETGVAAGAEMFYNEAQKRYLDIIAKFRTEIDRQLRQLSKERIPENFDSAYRLSSVSVVDSKIRRDWDLGFECLFDETFSVSIELSDWENGAVVVDS